MSTASPLTAYLPLDRTPVSTLCEAFRRNVEQHPDDVALRAGDGRLELTWSAYGDRVRAVAAGLSFLGVGLGDTVTLMLTNRPEAFVVDTAALMVGATPVSVYNTSSTEQLQYLVGHAESRVVVTESRFLPTVLAAKASLPALSHVFVVDDQETADLPTGARPLSALEAAGDPDFDLWAAGDAVRPDGVAVLIYTSGTTGPPKAVELTHANVVAVWLMSASAAPALWRRGRLMSYLPMAHMADRIVAHYASLMTGSTVTTFTDPKVALGSLRQVRPTFTATVPRMWEKMKAALDAQFAAEPDEATRAGVQAALRAAVAKVRLEQAGQPVPEDLAAKCARADEAIFSRVRAAIGFDDIDVLISGAAPIGTEVLEFFAAIGLPISEAWGMSETGAAGTLSGPAEMRIGTVGRPLPGMEATIADDGELLVRGPNLMRGYRKDPEQTADIVDVDGWLHTGDIATIDEDGYVRIVDRKKELIINAAGKNMSPSNIENHVKAGSSLIANVVAIGDRRPYNTALVTLDPEAGAEYARMHGLPDAAVAALARDEGVLARVAQAVEEANTRLSRVEQIKKYTVLEDEWLPGSAVLTPTMKLKRRPIAEAYAAQIEAMYA